MALYRRVGTMMAWPIQDQRPWFPAGVMPLAGVGVVDLQAFGSLIAWSLPRPHPWALSAPRTLVPTASPLSVVDGLPGSRSCAGQRY